MKVIYLNLEELKLERDALKEKVESLDQLAIERTEIINMYIKELVIEDKNLEANVLYNHQERRVLEKSFMSRNSAPVPSRSTLEVFIGAWKSNLKILKCVRLKLFSLLRIPTNPVKECKGLLTKLKNASKLKKLLQLKEAVGRRQLYPSSTLKKKQLKR
jgi:hypothetical protein